MKSEYGTGEWGRGKERRGKERSRDGQIKSKATVGVREQSIGGRAVMVIHRG